MPDTITKLRTVQIDIASPMSAAGSMIPLIEVYVNDEARSLKDRKAALGALAAYCESCVETLSIEEESHG